MSEADPEDVRAQLVVDPADVEERARAIVRERYVASSAQFRRPSATALNVALSLLVGLVPWMPGGEALTGASPVASIVGFGAVAAITVLAAAAHRAVGVEGRPYQLLTRAETVAYCGVSALLMASSGTAASVYWLPLGALVVVTATTLEHHRSIRAILAASIGGVIVWFAAAGAWADALLAAVLGGALLWFQWLATVTGWRAHRETARAELLAERAGELLVRHERAASRATCTTVSRPS